MDSQNKSNEGGQPGEDSSDLRSRLERALRTERVLERALADSEQELENAVVARDEFITIAAHELRSPMSAIALYVERLLLTADSEPSACSPEIRADLRRLYELIQHFIRRATVLLDVSRLTSGALSLELERVDLSELVRDVARQFALAAERAECALRVEVPSTGVAGYWDRLALEQVLTNLLSNAIKYGAGSPITLSLSATTAHAELRVRDRGPGISTEDRQRIFGKFERAVHDRRHGGFGVGLWITHQLIAALGGEIDVLSQPGQGSTFTVVLPLDCRGQGRLLT